MREQDKAGRGFGHLSEEGGKEAWVDGASDHSVEITPNLSLQPRCPARPGVSSGAE